MCKYFGLINSAKKHHVSSYWKNGPPSYNELMTIAKLLNWDCESDAIRSASYGFCFILKKGSQGYSWVDAFEEDMRMLDERCKMSKEDNEAHQNDWMITKDYSGQDGYAKFGFNGRKIIEFDGTHFCN